MYTQRVAWLASPVTPTCLAKSWLIESMQGAIYKKNLKKKKYVIVCMACRCPGGASKNNQTDHDERSELQILQWGE